MGTKTDPNVEQVQEALAAATSTIASLVAKAPGGLTGLELAQAWEENAAVIAEGVKGISPSVVLAAVKAEPQVCVGLAVAFLSANAGAIVGKPAQPVEKSDLVEVLKAISGVAVTLLSRTIDGFQPSDVLAALVANAKPIREAIEGIEEIKAQFEANPFGQAQAAAEFLIAVWKEVEGVLIALAATEPKK